MQWGECLPRIWLIERGQASHIWSQAFGPSRCRSYRRGTGSLKRQSTCSIDGERPQRYNSHTEEACPTNSLAYRSCHKSYLDNACRGINIGSMVLFVSILIIMSAAVMLAAASRRLGISYPVVLAIGGTALAFIPNAPVIKLDPDLVLALFVAPILLDAAFDSSPRDLRRNWLPLCSLVFVAVGVTTAVVAIVARWFIPELPWAAAIALGAIVAPPDAVAATAILRRVRPPHRIVVILEGESLLNDATALLIYRLASRIAASQTAFPKPASSVCRNSGSCASSIRGW